MLELSVDNGLATIVLNRPGTRNALQPDILASLIDALDEFEHSKAVDALLITGAGKAFSSGGDLNFLNELSQKPTDDIRSTVYRFFIGAAKKLKLFPKPTVAAVNGPAVGAGCELALACDFRIVSENAFFRENWIKLGLIPPLGGMFLLPHLVGYARATDMVLRGEPVRAAEAVSIGLAHKLVPADDLVQEAKAFAKQFVGGPSNAYAAAKEGLRRSLESSLAAEWEFNLHAQAGLLGSSYFREAVRR